MLEVTDGIDRQNHSREQNATIHHQNHINEHTTLDTLAEANGMPFGDQNDFPIAIGIVNEAIEEYPFERFGWKKSYKAPHLGMGAEAETGAQAAVPVEKL